jgi:hypothetical protein
MSSIAYDEVAAHDVEWGFRGIGWSLRGIQDERKQGNMSLFADGYPIKHSGYISLLTDPSHSCFAGSNFCINSSAKGKITRKDDKFYNLTN